MEHNRQNEEAVQQERPGVVKTFKPIRGTVSILRDVSEGIHPTFAEFYVRKQFFNPGAKIVFLPTADYGFPRYVTKEEAERIAKANPMCECPMCAMCAPGIPLSK